MVHSYNWSLLQPIVLPTFIVFYLIEVKKNTALSSSFPFPLLPQHFLMPWIGVHQAFEKDNQSNTDAATSLLHLQFRITSQSVNNLKCAAPFYCVCEGREEQVNDIWSSSASVNAWNSVSLHHECRSWCGCKLIASLLALNIVVSSCFHNSAIYGFETSGK